MNFLSIRGGDIKKYLRGCGRANSAWFWSFDHHMIFVVVVFYITICGCGCGCGCERIMHSS
jgi:hypothetical protein